MKYTIALALLAACSSGGGGGDGDQQDIGLEGLSLTAVNPGTVVPGTLLVIEGSSFVDEPWGTTRLRLTGTHSGATIDLPIGADFADFTRLEIPVDAAFFDAFGGEGDFEGSAVVEVDSSVDGTTHTSNTISLTLALREQLTPTVSQVATGSMIFVNDKIEVSGDGFLLGGAEGDTMASVNGCFTAQGDGECVAITPIEVPLVADPFDRTHGTFDFAPGIAGIRPGNFMGSVQLVNRPASGDATMSSTADVMYDVTEPALFSVNPTAASLGQFVIVEGGGFVGGDQGGATLLELVGTFAPDGGDPVELSLTLVTEWVEGRKVRYLMSEDDALGEQINLRRVTGTFTGEVTPVVQYDTDEVLGPTVPVTIAIAPVKQIVQLVFEPGYVESLRHFGLRAVDAQIRARIIEVVERDYQTINLELRHETPTDFAIYSVVEISGPDPNGLGLLGYDNSPGKDTGNVRLYDQIGGVNAVTQEDGSPGYGGVFIESLFAFSEHPGDYAEAIDQADGTFDEVFDDFRGDQGGDPVTTDDLDGLPSLDSGEGCPSDGDRSDRIACAVFVLGSLIGTTLSHEIGHSLGLANPFGEGFHNASDEPNRMMDNGGDRPFAERAELFGEGPGLFCVTEYDYLRDILPAGGEDDPQSRPTCF